jgi:hypothetical protein
VQLMVNPAAFDRQAMFEACIQLLAPVFKQAAEPVGEPLIPNPNNSGTARA